MPKITQLAGGRTRPARKIPPTPILYETRPTVTFRAFEKQTEARNVISFLYGAGTRACCQGAARRRQVPANCIPPSPRHQSSASNDTAKAASHAETGAASSNAATFLERDIEKLSDIYPFKSRCMETPFESERSFREDYF